MNHVRGHSSIDRALQKATSQDYFGERLATMKSELAAIENAFRRGEFERSEFLGIVASIAQAMEDVQVALVKYEASELHRASLPKESKED